MIDLGPLWRAEAAKPPDPHGMAFYFHRAESLLSGRAKTKMTPEIRAMLERHLAEARKIAAKPGPLNLPEEKALRVLVEIVSNLKPRIHLLLNRATAKAREELAKQTKDDVLNVIIAEETKPDLNRNIVLMRVNKRWTALGGSKITYDALRGRQKRQKKRSS
jgi:hypothetical protein